MERPGHLWEEDHLCQGFAWSPGIVGFSVPEHAETCRVTVDVVQDFRLSTDAISAVRVPFPIDEHAVLVS